MLNPDAAARVQIAVDAARELAKRLVSAGEQVASEIDRATIQRIREQRTAFLDLDAPELEVRLAEKGRAIELDPDVKAAHEGYVTQAQRELDPGEQLEV